MPTGFLAVSTAPIESNASSSCFLQEHQLFADALSSNFDPAAGAPPALITSRTAWSDGVHRTMSRSIERRALDGLLRGAP